MFTFQGISVDSYVMFVEECRVACTVNGAEIEIELGHRAGSLHLVTNEAGLAKLVSVLTEVSARLGDHPDDEDPQFSVPSA